MVGQAMHVPCPPFRHAIVVLYSLSDQLPRRLYSPRRMIATRDVTYGPFR